MSALTGLRVIDLSPTRLGAQTSQLFVDFGGDVIQIEPPGGAEIRQHAAYPFWARGKRSIVLDLDNGADRSTLKSLILHADILIESHQPGYLDSLGLGYAQIVADNPSLIYTSITGFGRQGPYSNAATDEGLVMAKLGGFRAFQRMSPHSAPPFVNVPFASFAASQMAIHGILAALIERSRSGRGQWVETNLAHAFTALDTWAWFEYLIVDRWPDAFTKMASFDELGRPASPLTFMLLVALTKDGAWLQFASVAPHLYAALMKSLGLAWMFADPEWQGMPVFEGQPEKRQALWTRMLEAAKEKTLSEWNEIFDADPNVFAEQFRGGAVALEHPQLLHDGFTVEIRDADRGSVRQPAAIVKATGTPASLTTSAPLLDEDRAEILALAAQPVPTAAAQVETDELPLAGVTVLELATLFAGPHGTTMLTDLGARVIKVEPLAGDRIRMILPFPEAGGFKVMQGKSSISVDLTTPEGAAIIQQIAATADVVVQGYRAGAMAKLGLDYASVRMLNPNVVYLNAPGYGVDGPYGSKPAYAPSIGAASGIPLANVGATVEARSDLTMDQIQDGARRLSAASASSNAQADGFAALGVATAILFGLVARDRGAGGQELFSSMINTGCHAMSAHAVTYAGAPIEPCPQADMRGLHPLYRIYDAAEGYVFLSATSDSEFSAFARAVAPYVGLGSDARFGDATSREHNSEALIDVLGTMFVQKTAVAWETELFGQGVGCLQVHTDLIETKLFDDSFGRVSGYVTDVVHPILDEHVRLTPYVRFSRSRTQALPAVLNGQQTDEILYALGKTADEIADLRARNVVG